MQMRASIEGVIFLPSQEGFERPLDLRAKYLEHLLSYVDRKKLTA